MKSHMALWLLAATAIPAELAVAGSEPAAGLGWGGDPTNELRFITCPVYQDVDAGRKSGCWLADDRATGVRYDVGASPTKPDWNHPILVEGRIAPGPQQDHACAGVRMLPVRVSVLPGQCTRHAIPAGGYGGRAFLLPERNVEQLSVPRPAVAPPFHGTTFTLFFDFGSDFLIYQYDDWLLDRAIAWIRAAHPRRIFVTGYADTGPQLVSGETLAEPASLARSRAEKIAEALRRLGVPEQQLHLRVDTHPTTLPRGDLDGVLAASRRRVEIDARM